MAEKSRGRYRRWRDDIFGHAKTGGMSLASYGLLQYAVSQNLLGVLQQSPRAIAARFSMPVEQVEAAIDELVRRGVAMFWPEIETLWVVEALDEQSDGPLVDRSAAKHRATLPQGVQSAMLARYGERLHTASETQSDRVVDTVPDTLSVGVSPQESGIRNQESGVPPTPASGGRRPRSKPTTDPRVTQVLDAIDAERVRVGLRPLPESTRTPTTIAARLKAGATVDELLEVVAAFGRLADREPDKRSVLCATTPFTGPSGQRPGGWAWGKRLLDEEASPGRRGGPGGIGPAVPRIGPALRSVDEVIAERDRDGAR